MSVSFRESRRFQEKFFSVADEEDLMRLQEELMANPERGDVIPGAGGARKVRMGIRGRGKRGGARVIYYVRVSRDIIWFLDIYGKNEKADLSKDEREEFAAHIRNLKEERP